VPADYKIPAPSFREGFLDIIQRVADAVVEIDRGSIWELGRMAYKSKSPHAVWLLSVEIRPGTDEDFKSWTNVSVKFGHTFDWTVPTKASLQAFIDVILRESDLDDPCEYGISYRVPSRPN